MPAVLRETNKEACPSSSIGVLSGLPHKRFQSISQQSKFYAIKAHEKNYDKDNGYTGNNMIIENWEQTEKNQLDD